MTTLNLQCGASAHDAEENVSTGGIGPLAGYTLRIGYLISARHVGLYFPSVSGLSGATINSATLTFRAYTSQSGSFIGDWYAHDAAAPGVFTTAAYNISSRTRTTATCEGDGSDFGNWTDAQDQTFTGDGTNTIASIIQELADSYDPSAIVLVWIYTSGTGARAAHSYDYPGGSAPKLDIDYTAGGGAITLTPDPATTAIVAPSPTLVFGAKTLTPDVTITQMVAPSVTVSLSKTLTPDPASIGITAPDVGVALSITLTPDPAIVTMATPSVSVFVGGDTILTPTPAITSLIAPEVTLAFGAKTLTPDPAILTLMAPSATVALALTLTPDAAITALIAPSVTILAGAKTLTPTPAILVLSAPIVVVVGGGAVSYTTYKTARTYDPAWFPTGSLFRIVVLLSTTSVSASVVARLYNVTDGAIVAGSEVSSTNTELAELISSSFSLPSGEKSYRIEFGGDPGGSFECEYAAVRRISS